MIHLDLLLSTEYFRGRSLRIYISAGADWGRALIIIFVVLNLHTPSTWGPFEEKVIPQVPRPFPP